MPIQVTRAPTALRCVTSTKLPLWEARVDLASHFFSSRRIFTGKRTGRAERVQ